MAWSEIKYWLSEASGLDMDALHVHAGILCQLAFALLLRRRLSNPIPWLLVLLLALGNEYYDWTREVWTDRARQRGEGIIDLWNTMLLPTVLMLAARFLPGLFRAGAPKPDSADPG